ncbi:hypothetical protein ACRQ1B_28625 [Rhizobium panacihumi]|uniref:hypothetical protein n=1 Tax=Rhizobium panacihumi TaxID=2008450 RepID=UPI003D7A1590
MTDIRPLTSDEHAAVQAYALEHGSDWKAALRDDWMNAKTTGTLQALRNSHGPSWLDAYSIADWPRSLFSAEIALDQTPDPRLAGLACRKLIAAFIESEGSVKWEELEDACALAVEAFGLPADFIAIAQEVAPSD